MSYSSLEKLVFEMSNANSLSETRYLRDWDLELFLPRVASQKLAVMAHVAVALALRSFGGRIGIHTPHLDYPGIPWLDGSLLEQLQTVSLNYDGQDRISHGRFSERRSVRLGLATPCADGFTADATGDLVGVNCVFQGLQEASGPAASLAVSLAFAKAFAFSSLRIDSYRDETFMLSLENFETSEVDTPCHALISDFGSLKLLGGGPVSAAVLYVLSLSGSTARVELIDHGRFEAHDHEDSVLVCLEDSGKCRRRAFVLADRAARPGLEITATDERHLQDLSDFVCVPEAGSVSSYMFANRIEEAHVYRATVDEGEKIGRVRCAQGFRSSISTKDGQKLCTSRAEAVMRSVALWRAVRNMSAPQEVKDDCSRIAYRKTPANAAFLSLAAGSLLVALYTSLIRFQPLAFTGLELNVLGRQSQIQYAEI
jgi:hypothetical protein